MEDKIADKYVSYNSTINQGRRIRRMRRTQLSFEKISNSSSQKYGQQPLRIYENGGCMKRSSSNSQPKVEQKQKIKEHKQASKQSNLKHVQNEYYVTIVPHVQNNQQRMSTKNSVFKQNTSPENSTPKLNSFQSIAKNMIEQLANNATNDKWNDPFQVSQSKNSKKRSKQEVIPLANNDYGIEAQPLKSNLSEKSNNQISNKKMNSSINKSISQHKNSKSLVQKQNQNGQAISAAFKEKLPSGFQDIEGEFPNQSKNDMIEASEPFSKLKLDHLQNPLIINSSSAKKQNWKDAIKSLTQISQLDNYSEMENSKKANFQMDSSKKIELKIQSMRQDNITQPKIDSTQKNSWKHLPLTSKQPSQRKSFDSLSSAQIGSLKGVLQYVQIHQYLVSLVDEFKETVQSFPTNTTQKQVVCFLLQRKHLLQKNNMIKALKGGKNIFNLSTFEISSQHLSKYLQTTQIKKIVSEMQKMNSELFKNLGKKYHEVKQTCRGNKYIKLQTPYDDFSKQIIRLLEIQLQQLNSSLQSAKTQEQQQKLENDIFDTMEMVFLLSELNGRKIKKIQFFEEISDFEEYYNQHQNALKDTFEYFRGLK